MIGRAALISLLVFTACMPGGAAMAGDADREQPVLVELFTSQGCSDCPPADDILTDLSRRSDVIALSFPITYWDMLGWKDTLASMANTARQKSYADALDRSGTYTPQMILDGIEDVVGNQRHSVVSAITRHYAQRREAPPIHLSAEYSRRGLNVAISEDAPAEARDATIWVMPVLRRAEVEVGGGENADRELVYTNVVRDIVRAGSWSGGERMVTVPLTLPEREFDAIAVVLQSGEYGQVIAATLVKRED